MMDANGTTDDKPEPPPDTFEYVYAAIVHSYGTSMFEHVLESKLMARVHLQRELLSSSSSSTEPAVLRDQFRTLSKMFDPSGSVSAWNTKSVNTLCDEHVRREKLYSLKITSFLLDCVLAFRARDRQTTDPIAWVNAVEQYLRVLKATGFAEGLVKFCCELKDDMLVGEALQVLVLVETSGLDEHLGMVSNDQWMSLIRTLAADKTRRVKKTVIDLESMRCSTIISALLDLVMLYGTYRRDGKFEGLVECLSSIAISAGQIREHYPSLMLYLRCHQKNQGDIVPVMSIVRKTMTVLADYCLYSLSLKTCRLLLELISSLLLNEGTDIRLASASIELLASMLELHPCEIGRDVVSASVMDNGLALYIRALMDDGQWKVLYPLICLPKDNLVSDGIHKRLPAASDSGYLRPGRRMSLRGIDLSAGAYLGLNRWRSLLLELNRTRSLAACAEIIQYAAGSPSWDLALLPPMCRNLFNRVLHIAMTVCLAKATSVETEQEIRTVALKLLVRYRCCLHPGITVECFNALALPSSSSSSSDLPLASMIIAIGLLDNCAFLAVQSSAFAILTQKIASLTTAQITAINSRVNQLLTAPSQSRLSPELLNWLVEEQTKDSIISSTVYDVMVKTGGQLPAHVIRSVLAFLAIQMQASVTPERHVEWIAYLCTVIEGNITQCVNAGHIDNAIEMFKGCRMFILASRNLFNDQQLSTIVERLWTLASVSSDPALVSSCVDVAVMLLAPMIDVVGWKVPEAILRRKMNIPAAQACVESALIAMHRLNIDSSAFRFSQEPDVSELSLSLLPHDAIMLASHLVGDFCRIASCSLLRYLHDYPSMVNPLAAWMLPGRFTYSKKISTNDKKFVFPLLNHILLNVGSLFLPVVISVLSDLQQDIVQAASPLLCSVVDLIKTDSFQRPSVMECIRACLHRFDSLLEHHTSEFKPHLGELIQLSQLLVRITPPLDSICWDSAFNPGSFPVFIKFRDDACANQPVACTDDQQRIVRFDMCISLCQVIIKSLTADVEEGPGIHAIMLAEQILTFVLSQSILVLFVSQKPPYGMKQYLRSEFDSVFSGLVGQLRRCRQLRRRLGSLVCLKRSSELLRGDSDWLLNEYPYLKSLFSIYSTAFAARSNTPGTGHF